LSRHGSFFLPHLPQSVIIDLTRKISGFLSPVPHPEEGRFAIVAEVEYGMRWMRTSQDE